MREYTNELTLSNNSRGIWSIDTTIGCYSGMKLNNKGCYNDCYSARYSKKYGYDFSKTVLRKIKNEKHKHYLIDSIKKIDMDFVRIGTSGDPSEDWGHTVSVVDDLFKDYQLSFFKDDKKEIVIITKHWFNLTDTELIVLSKYNVCVNTSISVLDNDDVLENSLKEYERIKPFVKSVLRVVSADFNLENNKGKLLNKKQIEIFKKYKVLDTVLRVYKTNPLVKEGVINIKKTKFLGKNCYVSKFNKKTYFGNCLNCIEQCGIKLN